MRCISGKYDIMKKLVSKTRKYQWKDAFFEGT